MANICSGRLRNSLMKKSYLYYNLIDGRCFCINLRELLKIVSPMNTSDAIVLNELFRVVA